jgi:hypothetical protein
MKISIFLCVVVFLLSSALAQEAAPAPTVHELGWKNSLVSGLTMTQVAFTDWAQGGESALSYTISAAGRSVDEESPTNWTTIYKFAFGQTRLGNEGLRKADDMIDLGSVLTYKLDSYVNPYISATLKTQFAAGYVYNAQGIGTPVSQFFDPAYITQTAGAGFQPLREIKTRLGLGLREIITNQFRQYTTDNEKVSVDGGFESVIEINWHLDENVLFTTQLSLFEPFKTMDVVVVRDNSSITARVSKYITTILNVQLINEKHVDPRTQVKEGLALGLSYTLF